MDLKQELIDKLGVPKNWDKYDYQTQRYSFDDMQEVLEGIVKKINIPVVVLQSEQFSLEDVYKIAQNYTEEQFIEMIKHVHG